MTAEPRGGEPLTIALRVVPRSSRTSVGGRRADALVVRVTEPAVDGRATEAALVAVARALGVRRRDVRLRSGATSRDKIVLVEGPRSELLERLARVSASDLATSQASRRDSGDAAAPRGQR